MTVRNTINCMQFEGVSKDDINYHMLVYYRPTKASNSRMIGQGDDDGGFGAGLDAEPGNQGQGKGQSAEINQLLLFYPNGIIAIYDNIIQAGGAGNGRKKVHLKEVLQADYEQIIAPQILRDKLLFVSWQPVPVQQNQNKN